MTLSAADLEWLHQRDGAEPGILLATIYGQDMPGGVIRLARNTEDVISRGQTYSSSWFDVVLPGSDEEQSALQLVFPNKDNEIGLVAMEIKQSLYATIELVRPADFNRVIVRVAGRKLRRARIDPLKVTFELSVIDLMTQPYNTIRVTPANFPWMNYV